MVILIRVMAFSRFLLPAQDIINLPVELPGIGLNIARYHPKFGVIGSTLSASGYHVHSKVHSVLIFIIDLTFLVVKMSIF